MTPIRVHYRGYDVWEIPPNGQGLVALLALNIVKGFNFSEKETVDTYHKQIEAMKLAFTDGKAHITDPFFMKMNVADVLSDEYGSIRRSEIAEEASCHSRTSLQVGARFISPRQTVKEIWFPLFRVTMGFGSGLVVPGTGISLKIADMIFR